MAWLQSLRLWPELYYTPSPAGIGCKLPPKEGMSLVFHSCAPGPPVLLGSDHCLHPVPILKGPRSQSLSLWVKPIQLPSGAGSPRFGQLRAASGGGESSNVTLGCRPNPKGSLTLCKQPDCHRETWLVGLEHNGLPLGREILEGQLTGKGSFRDVPLTATLGLWDW